VTELGTRYGMRATSTGLLVTGDEEPALAPRVHSSRRGGGDASDAGPA
jgi:hypothetical protein